MPEDPAAAPAAALAALADAYWGATLEFNPIYATYLGDRRFDHLLDDRSDDAIERQAARLDGFHRQVEAIDDDRLDTEDRITRSALLAQVRRDRAQLDADLESWAVDPLNGPQVTALDLEALQPVATTAEAERMVTRWRAMGPWFDERAKTLNARADDGRVAVRAPVERVVEQLDSALATGDDDLPLLAPLRVDRPDWSPDARAAFERDLRSAVHDVVRPALARYRDTVRDEILPRARPDDRPGLAHLPGGREAYDRLIELHTSLSLSADDVHAIGLEEIQRIDRDLAVLGERVLGTSDLPTIRRRLREDPAMHFGSREEVRAAAEDSLARARAAVPAWFGIQPKADCVVVPMQPHAERHATIAYYREPTEDGTRPGQYHINTSEPETRPRYEAQALAFHEAIPGHHLQLAISQELTGLPDFRRLAGPTAYVEGWGLYAERLSEEMGLYTGDLDRIGVLSFDAWRACRLVVDTGMHALGWTRSQAIEFMFDHTALARNNVTNEIDRYIVDPGQALAYKIGQREILRLRRRSEEELGARFEIRSFHDAVLSHGVVGLDTLGEIVADWSRGLALVPR